MAKTLVTEGKLMSFAASALEQLVGVVASTYGRRLGQSKAVKAVFDKLGSGWVATAISALGLTGLGAVFSNKDLIGNLMQKIGVPVALVDPVTESVGDFFDGASAERLRLMSEPEAEQAIKEHTAKKAAELSAKTEKMLTETKTFEQAYRLLTDLQKQKIVDYLDAMPVGMKETWVTSYRPRLILAQDIADALRMTRNWPGFLAYLDDIFPAKSEFKTQAKVLSLMEHGMSLATKVVGGFVEDPKKALNEVAASIDAGTAELEKKNAVRKLRLERLRKNGKDS